MLPEPLLQPSGRLSIFPIRDHTAWKFYKQSQGCIWTAEEINFSKDLEQWEGLSPDIRRVVEAVLGFFAGADRIVNINLAQNMMSKIDHPELQCFYAFQNMMENIHGETYSLMIEALIKDPVRKAELLASCDTMSEVANLYNWTRRWIHATPSDKSELAGVHLFAKQLIAQACIEGIAFSGAFAIIFYIKERGVLQGLTFSNELISRDEGLHRDFACYVYSLIQNKLPESEVLQIVTECVEATEAIIASCMSRLPGMNRDDMNTYIRYVADSLLGQLGLQKHYKVTNPFDFMDKISFNGITNFFERRVAEYGVSGFEEGHDQEITLSDDY